MALSLVKKSEPDSIVGPHTVNLRGNLRGIREKRELLDAVHAKDRAALADIAKCEETEREIATIESEIDTQRADATYGGLRPPDTRSLERRFQNLQHILKRQQDVARAATLIRAKYATDIQKFGDAISALARETTRLTFLAAREDELAGLTSEYLRCENAFLQVRQRAFSAARLCDVIAREHSYGEFSGSGAGADFRIPRPQHPAYDDGLTPEQSYAEREKYSQAIAAGAAELIGKLQGMESTT